MRHDTIARNDERIMHAVRYVSAWVRDGWAHIDIESLARETNTAPHHFRRIFRDATGKPLLRFVRRLRLQLAAYRLVFTAEPVIDIALAAGYGSAAAFSRAFREAYGSCPASTRSVRPESPWPSYGLCCEGLDTVTQGAQAIAFYRHFGLLGDVNSVWRKVSRWSARQGDSEGAARHVLLCYDDPGRFLGESMRYDVGVTMADGAKPDDGIGVQVVKEQRLLLARHAGPLEFLPFSYMHLAVAAVMGGLAEPTAALPFVAYLDQRPAKDSPRVIAQVGIPLRRPVRAERADG
ncbi:helix-turn-helix domain-containing protein [Streptomyces sp. NPDC052051]|uniref:helix-turn-helix domain-containing protein n=1 Tax=Streptomyces sp. NPDC052051 TaxID=3154649 RepID=UPI00341B4788